MSDKAKNIIGYIVVFVVLFLVLTKGIDWWTHYKMIKESDERITFAIQNNNAEKCAIISNAISIANTLTDQKALDRYKIISQDNSCEGSSTFVEGVSTAQEAAAYAEQQARN